MIRYNRKYTILPPKELPELFIMPVVFIPWKNLIITPDILLKTLTKCIVCRTTTHCSNDHSKIGGYCQIGILFCIYKITLPKKNYVVAIR